MFLSSLTDFKDALKIPFSLEAEDDTIANALAVVELMRDWLQSKNLHHPYNALALLMKHKYHDYSGGPMRTRRDGRTPDFLHEIRISASVISDYYDGLIPEVYLEPLLCLAYTHDLGEEFNFLPDAIAKYYDKHTRQTLRLFGKNTDHPLADVEYLALGMERLTFDRKYTDTQILKELGITKKIEVGPELLEALLDKIKTNSRVVNGYLPQIGYIPEPDHQGRYIFSRFINEDGVLDWNLYARAFRNDPNTGLIKMKDRGDGLGTRIGPNFDITKYGRYLSTTFQIFSVNNIGDKMAAQYPDLSHSFLSTDKMLGALHRKGRIYVETHPQTNPPGSKGISIQTLPENLDFRDFYPGCMVGYRRMPAGMNPDFIMMTRIQNDFTLNGRGPILHEKIVHSIENTIGRNNLRSLSSSGQLVLDFGS